MTSGGKHSHLLLLYTITDKASLAISSQKVHCNENQSLSVILSKFIAMTIKEPTVYCDDNQSQKFIAMPIHHIPIVYPNDNQSLKFIAMTIKAAHYGLLIRQACQSKTKSLLQCKSLITDQAGICQCSSREESRKKTSQVMKIWSKLNQNIFLATNL